ncbi:RNA polymerase sigma factor [Roseateles chitinivorans]|uniref:RNA polymerase sigma factor n=1 Tax=Roseateles chitinivorans TaxID=2917965 RepID=UPI003D66B851
MNRNWLPVFSRVRAALMRRGRSCHDADDLVQEAWIRLASYAQRQTVLEPEAFLMRAALNLSIDDYRSGRSRCEQVMLDDVEEKDLVDTTPTVETTLLARERVARLIQSLAGLGEKTQRIFLANRIEGLTYNEIARAQKLSVGAIEKHIAKATLHLTRDMEGW